MSRANVKSKLKGYEGLRLRNYKDHLGNDTIGHGHLNKEGYTLITMEKANQLLEEDVDIAYADFNKLGLPELPEKWEDFIVMMLFQLGYTKVTKFKKFLNAIQNGWWSTAVKEARDSLWYRQTTRRVESMIAEVEGKSTR